ncbi:hypothetical protein IFO70_31235 [Phormidium tenue FACHB-886]|nr:hypothetical protein [Phormidium tenue FACHB-886]
MTKQLHAFFRKVSKANHTQPLQVITVDKDAAYPLAIEVLKAVVSQELFRGKRSLLLSSP